MFSGDVKPPWLDLWYGAALPAVTVNLVLVEETNPPEGDTPIQWLLVTSLPVTEGGQVRQIVAYDWFF